MSRRAIVLCLVSVAAVFAVYPSWCQEGTGTDLIGTLSSIQTPESWSAKLHVMIHVGPYTFDMTGDYTAHGELVKSRMISGVGGRMIYLKIYTGQDGIQWMELSSPPRKKEVAKIDLNKVMEATEGAPSINLLSEIDGSSTALGVNMGESWRQLLELFGDDATVRRKTVEGEDIFEVELIFSKDTYFLIDPSGELREDDVYPTVLMVQIGAEDGLPRYMALLTTEEAFSFEVIFKDFELNPAVDPASFEYTPPMDVNVKDATAEAIAELTGQPLEEEVEDFRLIY